MGRVCDEWQVLGQVVGLSSGEQSYTSNRTELIHPGQVRSAHLCNVPVDATRARARTGDCQCSGRRLEIFIELAQRTGTTKIRCQWELTADERARWDPRGVEIELIKNSDICASGSDHSSRIVV